MDFLPEGTFSRGVTGGLLVGMAWFVLVCLYRSVRRIVHFGPWAWLKSAFTIDRDSLSLFLVLLLLLLATVLCFPPGRPA